MSKKEDIYNELEMRLNPDNLTLASSDAMDIMNQYDIDEEVLMLLYQELTSKIVLEIKDTVKEIVDSYKEKWKYNIPYQEFKKEFEDYGYYSSISDNILKNIYLSEKEIKNQLNLFEVRKLIRKILKEEINNNQYIVDDLLAIGKNKPLGYLPLKTMIEKKHDGYDGVVEDVISWADSKGYKHVLCTEQECHIASGALYIYDPLSLSDMLDKYQDILEKANIPTTPDEYVRHIMKKTIYDYKYPEAYKVIGLTFADKRFKIFEDINIPINVGDEILGGKFKNKKIKVKEIGKNDKGDITINGKPLLRFRIPKK